MKWTQNKRTQCPTRTALPMSVSIPKGKEVRCCSWESHLDPFQRCGGNRWESTSALSPSRSLLVAAVSHEANKIIFPKLPVTYLFKSHLQVSADEAFLLTTGQVCPRSTGLPKGIPGVHPGMHAFPLMLHLFFGVWSAFVSLFI